MTLREYLNCNLRVLGIFGCRWDAGKIKLSQILFSIFKLTLFCVIFGIVFFDPSSVPFSSNAEKNFLQFLYFSRTAFFIASLVVDCLLSLLYRRSERLRFYRALDYFENLIIKCVDKRSREKRKIKVVFCFAVLYHAFLITIFLILHVLWKIEIRFFRIFINFLYVIGDFFILRSLSLLNFIIYTLRSNLELTNEMISNQNLKTKQILNFKVKLFEIIVLFNRCFGLMILFVTLRSLMTLVGYMYMFVGKIMDGPKFLHWSWLIMAQMNNLPINIASYILFFDAEKVKKEVKFS